MRDTSSASSPFKTCNTPDIADCDRAIGFHLRPDSARPGAQIIAEPRDNQRNALEIGA